MKCANCSENADYVYEVTPSYKVHYCGRHLPKFLSTRAKSGELNVPLVVPPAAPTVSKKKAAAPVVEEPVVEEAVVEEAVEEDGIN
jgi:hypothetical protein